MNQERKRGKQAYQSLIEEDDIDDGKDVFVHQTEIQAEGFRSLADGEPVEYFVETDDSGRSKATKVTGPGGANVQGAPFRPQSDYEY